MPVKSYKWPFPVNPHTLLINEEEGRWSASVCNEMAYVLVAPGHEPEYVVKAQDGRIIKNPLVPSEP